MRLSFGFYSRQISIKDWNHERMFFFWALRTPHLLPYRIAFKCAIYMQCNILSVVLTRVLSEWMCKPPKINYCSHERIVEVYYKRVYSDQILISLFAMRSWHCSIHNHDFWRPSSSWMWAISTTDWSKETFSPSLWKSDFLLWLCYCCCLASLLNFTASWLIIYIRWHLRPYLPFYS